MGYAQKYKKTMNKLFRLTFVALALISFVSCAQEEVEVKEEPKAVNVIYMIGDGMALPQVYGTMIATGQDLAFTHFPYVGVVDTHSASNLITDSSASGTALACGVKTRNGMVGMDADSVAVESVLDVMARMGKSAGIVVTCYVTHATPAVFYANDPKRSNYENIAAQMAESDNLNVVIGGGRKHFTQRADSINLVERMEKELGWKVYDTLADIDVTCSKYAVLANNDHMPRYSERGDFLSRGVQTALSSLERNENGFFLMVEGSQIDFEAHNNDSIGIVNEVVDFSNAINVALDFAKTHENTLVVVAADHETGGMTLIDPKGHYADPAFRFSTHSHTCLPTLVYAYGPGAEQFTGWMQNSDLKSKIMKACGIEIEVSEETVEPTQQIAPIKANFDTKAE